LATRYVDNGLKEDIKEIKKDLKENTKATARLYTIQATTNQKLSDHIIHSQELVDNNLPVVKKNKSRLDKIEGRDNLIKNLVGAGWLVTIITFVLSIYLNN
jgi:hypothetical protein